MKYKIIDLKEAVNRLETALLNHKHDEVDKNARLISNIVSEIRSNFTEATSSCTKEENLHIESHLDVFKYINKVQFIYKPTPFVNIYEADDIDSFVRERTEELSESGAMEVHNAFWQEHQIVYGNVYGSIPLELLPAQGANRLKKCGWRESEVEIFEFKKDVTEKEAKEVTQKFFRHYIIIKETATKSTLVLRYTF